MVRSAPLFLFSASAVVTGSSLPGWQLTALTLTGAQGSADALLALGRLTLSEDISLGTAVEATRVGVGAVVLHCLVFCECWAQHAGHCSGHEHSVNASATAVRCGQVAWQTPLRVWECLLLCWVKRCEE